MRASSASLIGAQLRAARQARGLTLYQAERLCGARWDYLQAIEQESWAALPRAQEPESHPGNGEGAPLGATLSQAPLASPVSDDNSSAGPVYTRWWFWTAVGAVVVAGGVSAYLIFGRNENCSAAMGATCGKW